MDRWLILASASPRRKALLEQVGIEIEVVPSGVEETVRKNEDPRDHVRRMAREKTEAVASRFPDRWVIGADTTVVIDGEPLGKPQTQKDAREMLSLLSGRIHQVLTGYAIAMKKESLFVSDVVETRVRMKHLSLEEISWYVRTGEPFGKAGAYAIQGAGAFMIEGIEGSYTNVVGLPVCQVLESLRALGAIDLK
jgi:septum formation protein